MKSERESAFSPRLPRIVKGEIVDTTAWALPDLGALGDGGLAQFLKRQLAVKLFLHGESSARIKEQCAIGAKQAYRLIVDRCLQAHPDGGIYGWRGLLRYHRIRPYKRHRPVELNDYGDGGAGALDAVLDAHPELRIAFEKLILSRTPETRLTEARRTRRRECAWLLDQLRTRGYETRRAWPFNTMSLGYYGIRAYIDKVLQRDVKALAGDAGGPDLVKKLDTGDGTRRPVTRFMQRVEMDAHKLDGRFCVSLPQLDGSTVDRIVHRLWVIVILEILSRAVVGYYFCMGKEVSKADVLRAIRRALEKWEAGRVSFHTEPYHKGAGLLSAAGDEFVGLCWDETSVDGALAETCKDVRSALSTTVGSELIEPKTGFSKRHSKDDRPFIEAFFRNLASKGFQRLSNTTGAKASERKGRKPDDVALASSFQFEYAIELLDVLIANYNAQPHRGISMRSPLDYARFLFRHTASQWRYADPQKVEMLLSCRKLCTVRGGAAVGRAPYVEFWYARYSSEMLQRHQELVGQRIWITAHQEDDCRVVLASTQEGVALGALRAAAPWHRSPHSLAVRKAINQASTAGKFMLPAGCDAIEEFVNFVESRAKKKLPVHPAYLEARRILVAAAEQSVGISMLESAQMRAAATEAVNEDVANGQAHINAAPPQGKESVAAGPLPGRRMIATRK